MIGSNKNKNTNAQKLEELGILTKSSFKRRNDDIEEYLKEKVERDEVLLKELVQIYKKKNPNTIVTFPISLHH